MRFKFSFTLFAILLVMSEAASSCTSFIKTGDLTSNYAPILTKVRDTAYPVSKSAYYKEDLRFFRQDASSWAYIAVMFGQQSNNGERNNISVGTNEAGLSLALNYATSQAKLIKTLYNGSIAADETKIMGYLLQHSANVQDAMDSIKAIDQQQIKDVPYLVPCILTMSDHKSGAVVEIAVESVDGDKKIHYQFKTADRTGNTYVTNHFDLPLLMSFNYSPTQDSAARYNRISELFNQDTNMLYDLSTALRFAKDYNGGELNSIFRNASRTTYIVEGKEQQAKLFVEFTNTAQLYNKAVITLDKNFWLSHKDGDFIINADESYVPPSAVDQFMTY